MNQQETGMHITLKGQRELDPNEQAKLRWVVIRPSDKTDLEIIRDLGWNPYYGGEGNPYAYSPKVRRVKKRVLITQQHGRDIR